ncbi:MAG: type 1 glutamine amidotransferase, partial [Acidimicrobiaceae bacterium]|nr:type 1 glutamine amidotransferase [Acidimicrobiaceae bacterium]
MGSHDDATRVAFLMANSGVEQVELTRPWEEVTRSGGRPELIAPEPGEVQAFNHDVDRASRFPVDVPVGNARAEDYDLLVLPGGTTNPDRLRMNASAMSFLIGYLATSKPVAAICHGPWSLVEVGAVRGKTLTSWPSLQTDIRNAGGTWIDQPVSVCPANGWTLVTSRKPDDLDAFCAEIAAQLEQ